MEDSKRRFPRMQSLHLITFVNREGEEQRTPVSMGRVTDISPAGIGMEVFEEVRPGSVMEMEVDLRDSLLTAQGKVVRVAPTGDGKYLVGVEFTELQPRLNGITAAVWTDKE